MDCIYKAYLKKRKSVIQRSFVMGCKALSLTKMWRANKSTHPPRSWVDPEWDNGKPGPCCTTVGCNAIIGINWSVPVSSLYSHCNRPCQIYLTGKSKPTGKNGKDGSNCGLSTWGLEEGRPYHRSSQLQDLEVQHSQYLTFAAHVRPYLASI